MKGKGTSGWGLIAAGMVMMALTGSQCSRVSDRLTGPTDTGTGINAGDGGVSACVTACNEVANAARDAEKILHKSNLDACKVLSGSARSACMEAENARHDARQEEIDMDLEACKAPCHEQGSGSGGQ